MAGRQRDEFRVQGGSPGGVARVGMVLGDAGEEIQRIQPRLVVRADPPHGFQQRAGFVDVALEFGLRVEQQDAAGVVEFAAGRPFVDGAGRRQFAERIIDQQFGRLPPDPRLPGERVGGGRGGGRREDARQDGQQGEPRAWNRENSGRRRNSRG